MAKQIYNRDFKLAVVRRVAAGESVSRLSGELGVRSRNIYRWLDRFREGGAAALRPDGRPTRLEAAEAHLGSVAEAASDMPPPDPPDQLEVARVRIAALERKVGRQELELDFFQKALRHVREVRSSSDAPGGLRSSPRSRR